MKKSKIKIIPLISPEKHFNETSWTRKFVINEKFNENSNMSKKRRNLNRRNKKYINLTEERRTNFPSIYLLSPPMTLQQIRKYLWEFYIQHIYTLFTAMEFTWMKNSCASIENFHFSFFFSFVLNDFIYFLLFFIFIAPRFIWYDKNLCCICVWAFKRHNLIFLYFFFTWKEKWKKNENRNIKFYFFYCLLSNKVFFNEIMISIFFS